MPFTGAGAPVQTIPAPVSVAPVTLAGASPRLAQVQRHREPLPDVHGGRRRDQRRRVTPAGTCTVSGAVTVFVATGVPPTFASTQVALAESVPLDVAVQPVQVRAWVAAMPFTGAGEPAQTIPAPVSVAPVTLAGAAPLLVRFSVTENPCPTFTVVADGTSDAAVTRCGGEHAHRRRRLGADGGAGEGVGAARGDEEGEVPAGDPGRQRRQEGPVDDHGLARRQGRRRHRRRPRGRARRSHRPSSSPPGCPPRGRARRPAPGSSASA